MFDFRIRSALAVSATALLLSGPVLAQQQADPPPDQQLEQQAEQQPEQIPEALGALLHLSAEDVRAVQEALQQAGYELGDPDGLWGERSMAAMREFQEDEGLPVSGNIDMEALRTLDLWDSIMTAEGEPRQQEQDTAAGQQQLGTGTQAGEQQLGTDAQAGEQQLGAADMGMGQQELRGTLESKDEDSREIVLRVATGEQIDFDDFEEGDEVYVSFGEDHSVGRIGREPGEGGTDTQQ